MPSHLRAGHAEALGLARQVGDRRVAVERGAHAELVVDDQEDHRQLPERGEVHGLAEGALVGGAVAHHREDHVLGALVVGGQRHARGEREGAADDAVAAEEAPLAVEQVHRAAAAAGGAVLAAEQLGHHGVGVGAARERLAVLAIGRHQVVGLAQRLGAADDGGLLADARGGGSRRPWPWRTSRPRAPRSGGSAASCSGSGGRCPRPGASGCGSPPRRCRTSCDCRLPLWPSNRTVPGAPRTPVLRPDRPRMGGATRAPPRPPRAGRRRRTARSPTRHRRDPANAERVGLGRGLPEAVLDGLGLDRLEQRVGVELAGGAGDHHVVEVGEVPAGGERLPEGGEREGDRAADLLRERGRPHGPERVARPRVRPADRQQAVRSAARRSTSAMPSSRASVMAHEPPPRLLPDAAEQDRLPDRRDRQDVVDALRRQVGVGGGEVVVEDGLAAELIAGLKATAGRSGPPRRPGRPVSGP